MTGVKMADMISKRQKKITFCTANDTDRLDTDTRIAVAEAFAGLAMVALHEGNMFHAIGYARVSLLKHPSALPLVNCSRIMAVAKRDMHSVLELSRMVFVPYYLRIGDVKNHTKELSLWAPEFHKTLTGLPSELTFDSQCTRFNGMGEMGVLRCKFKKAQFVEKVCAVCLIGTQEGDKVKSCARCGLVYYCGKECQLLDWPQHRKVCRA